MKANIKEVSLVYTAVMMVNTEEVKSWYTQSVMMANIEWVKLVYTVSVDGKY